MANEVTAAPFERGKEYKVVLGKSLRPSEGGEGDSGAPSFHTWTTSFRPASIAGNAPALAELNDADQTIAVGFPTKNSADAIVFTGKRIDQQRDYLLIFDEDIQAFVLEKVSTHTQLRHDRYRTLKVPSNTSVSAENGVNDSEAPSEENHSIETDIPNAIHSTASSQDVLQTNSMVDSSFDDYHEELDYSYSPENEHEEAAVSVETEYPEIEIPPKTGASSHSSSASSSSSSDDEHTSASGHKRRLRDSVEADMEAALQLPLAQKPKKEEARRLSSSNIAARRLSTNDDDELGLSLSEEEG